MKQEAIGSSQGELFPRSKKPLIALESNHRLVQLADRLDWTELERLAGTIRIKKLKNRAGRRPHLRPLIGAVLMMAGRKMTYREAEDQIRHYAPARYLCGLTESTWTPDFTTIQDFTQLLGEDGLALINQYAVQWAVREKLADPRVMVADTTAQEANIPYPNEMGLLASFLNVVGTTSKQVGGSLEAFAKQMAGKLQEGKEMVRRYRLFAKTKDQKDKLTAKMTSLVDSVQKQFKKALAQVEAKAGQLSKRATISFAQAKQVQATAKKLVPQIRYWLKTGFVAKGKVISLHIPELYAVVRGKVGKKVEFGLKWGIRRLRGGYLLATMGLDNKELAERKFALRAVDDHQALFGRPPEAYAYDRGGYSIENVAKLKKLGVKKVALAPVGKAKWAVSKADKQELVKERAKVEGGIGTIKSSRYGFNRPAARSLAMMGACGQRAVLGFNLTKLVRELAMREKMVVVA